MPRRNRKSPKRRIQAPKAFDTLTGRVPVGVQRLIIAATARKTGKVS